MANEDSLELGIAIVVGDLDTPKESLVHIGRVVGISIARHDYTGVGTGRITVPEIDVSIRDRLVDTSMSSTST